MARELSAHELRDALHQQFSDTHKELYGVRPRVAVDHWTVQDFEDEIAYLRGEIEIESRPAPTSGTGWAYHGDEAALDSERMEVASDESLFGMTYDEMPLPGEDY